MKFQLRPNDTYWEIIMFTKGISGYRPRIFKMAPGSGQGGPKRVFGKTPSGKIMGPNVRSSSTGIQK